MVGGISRHVPKPTRRTRSAKRGSDRSVSKAGSLARRPTQGRPLLVGLVEPGEATAPAGASSLGNITALVIAPDAGAYAYTYGEATTTLYEVRGTQ